MGSQESNSEWIVLLELGDLLHLQSLKALLEEQGIEAAVMSLQDSMYPSISRYRLMVPLDVKERAMEILNKNQNDE